MSARLIFILAFSAVVWVLPAGADPVVNLYAADVRVHDQTAQTRASALQDVLSQVLVKVTGTQAALQTSEAATLLENPARYLQQYRYEAIRPAPEDPAAPRLLLHAEFDGNAIERRLRAAGLPLWGRERPLTLAWVAYSDGAERRLVGRDANDPIVDALRRATSRRGLPLVLPAMDAEDATRVSFMDVWGIFEEPLLAAAERYAPDAVLVGSIFRAGDDLWAGRWTVLRDGQRQRWESSGTSAEAVAVSAIDALAEIYAREFAVQTGTGGSSAVVVEVTNVGRLGTYADVQSYLSGLSVVKHAALREVDGNRLRFELALNSSVRALEQAIALGRVLSPLPPEDTVVRLGPPTGSGAQVAGEPGSEALMPPAENTLIPAPRVLRYRYGSPANP